MILVCSNTAWYLWNFRLRLMETLQDNGYEVVACAPHDQYVDKIEAAGIRFIPIAIDRRGTNPIIESFLIANYWRIISTERPSVILTYTPKPNIYASLAARLHGVPVINNIAGLGYIFIQGGIKTTIVRQLYKQALRWSQRVFFQNRDDLHEFIESGLVRKEQTGLLPGSGVDTDKFAPLQPSPDKNGFSFLLIARMLWDKGIGEYYEAARIIHSSTTHPPKFLLLGPVDEGNPAAIPHEMLQQWNREGIVTWLGSSDDVPRIIADCDCVVLPSYYREGVPRSLLEAASMGKPIITTDVPGCRETVENGVTGYLCPPRDSRRLAEQMTAMWYLQPLQRQVLGEAGRLKMKAEFEEQVVIARYLTEIARST